MERNGNKPPIKIIELNSINIDNLFNALKKLSTVPTSDKK